MKTIRQLYNYGISKLLESDVPDSDIDAKYLLEYVTGIDKNTMLLNPDKVIDDSTCKRYEEVIDMRCTRKPLQYITGVQEFMGLEFEVNSSVLIPRQDTEILVENALKYAKESNVLDMCTGSGCIAISIAKFADTKSVIGCDLSNEALKVADDNRKKLLKDNCDVVKLVQSDLFSSLSLTQENGKVQVDKFDLVVSNPPYIPGNVIDTLMPEVRFYEPDMALRANNNGLYFYEKITNLVQEYMNKGSIIFYEIGYEQGISVSNILKENSFTDVKIIKDYAGHDRVVCGVFTG